MGMGMGMDRTMGTGRGTGMHRGIGAGVGVAASVAASLLAGVLLFPALGDAQQRARDLGIPLAGEPGRHNAITDVPGVEVGQVTLISGEGRLVRGEGPVRTGVTAILPRGRVNLDPVFAGWFNLNGNGEMTGTEWIDESGFLTGPLMLTNTFSVGTVRDATIAWQIENAPDYYLGLPVVAETSDRLLNDRGGFHVKAEHAFEALAVARGGPVAEGAVGAGTGTICHQFKAGIGTASRQIRVGDAQYSVGVLVQCNYGERRLLHVAGVPVGPYLTEQLPCYDTEGPLPSGAFPRCSAETGVEGPEPGGSIIIVVATDAPLLPHQLRRVAVRASLGLARLGSIAGNSSGDIFLAFSTANPGAWGSGSERIVGMLPNESLNPVFEATIQATEEAILNSMLMAETMVGADFLKVSALPHDRLREILARYNRLNP
jgi:D-aminopeptidase